MKIQHKCPKCEHTYKVGFWKWFWAAHLFDIWRWMKCPNCEKYGWAKIQFKE